MFTRNNKERKMKNDNTFNYDDILSQVTDEEIIRYLKEVCKMTDELVQEQIERFKQHNDIYQEFKYAYFNIKNHNNTADLLCFAVNEPITEQGYTAYSLYHRFGGSIMPIGIFNLLISLREDKEETLDYIKLGLPNKDDSTFLNSEKDFKNPFYEKGEEKLQKKEYKKLEKLRKKILKKMKKEGFNEENPFA